MDVLPDPPLPATASFIEASLPRTLEAAGKGHELLIAAQQDLDPAPRLDESLGGALQLFQAAVVMS
jgi:hypothetical protein